MNQNIYAITVGKYLISPLARALQGGGFGASVSIRSGRGSASTDRVMRFTGSFDSESAALRHGREQGLAWVAESGAGRASACMLPRWAGVAA